MEALKMYDTLDTILSVVFSFRCENLDMKRFLPYVLAKKSTSDIWNPPLRGSNHSHFILTAVSNNKQKDLERRIQHQPLQHRDRMTKFSVYSLLSMH